ncbi:HTH_Tnp_Tc3_2 domain-containing protein [Trichonephila clavipes]|nr:HTH_Tnp_Tc3_2 domain-containing protein [Trichonephila clavipes]
MDGTVSRRPDSRWPRGTTGREHRRIRRTGVEHRTASAAEIQAAFGTTVTQRSVRNRLLQGQLRGRSPDLSPIEQVWDIIRRQLQYRPQPELTVPVSTQQVQQAWIHDNKRFPIRLECRLEQAASQNILDCIELDRVDNHDSPLLVSEVKNFTD